MMSISNKVLKVLDNPLTRSLALSLIYIGYRLKGKKIDFVKSHHEIGAWEFRINGISYLSTGPGWIYSYDFLYDQLKKLACFNYLPKSGDVVIDIGAGVGEETIIFSSLVGKSGKVFAVEAHPKTFRALNYLKNVNSLDNVICANVAFSDAEGEVIIEDSNNSLGNSIVQQSSKNSFQVHAITLDDFVEQNKIERIDFVKMNVEGAEQLIIRGMEKSINRVKNIAISCHDFRYKNGESEFFKTKEIVLKFLKEKKFLITTQNTSKNMVDDYVYAVNPQFFTERNE
ncbi:MAG: FkbM family methyltransferase [Cytophagia bacterium]|nr:FkbM family methyltransferase [Cytophagia bacterium]